MRDFLKNVSIYGILPVIGKFLGFFLVPIYARIFPSEAFGQVELIITLMSFMMFLVNLEFYSAIGRYFYEKETENQRKNLISTGLGLTALAACLVLLLCMCVKDVIIGFYLDGADLSYELNVGFVWLFISAFSTYLGVIPRYAKKPKLYVIVNSISLLFRLLCTILFVVVFKIGIVGVLYGHICGASMSLLLNYIISKQYIGFNFDKKDACLILRYALPIVPGLIVVGLWQPLFKNTMSIYFSVSVVGLYSFASRITSLTTMFNGALRNAWRPMLFENIKNQNFINETKRVSGLISFVILSAGIILTLLSPEICLLIGTEEYAESAILIPFLVLAGLFSIQTQMRGFGPLINERTYISSVTSFLSVVVALLCFYAIENKCGLIGIGIVLVLYDFLQYIMLYWVTKRYIQKSLVPKIEYVLMLLFIISTVFLLISCSFVYRLLIAIVLGGVLLFINKKYYKIFVK